MCGDDTLNQRLLEACESDRPTQTVKGDKRGRAELSKAHLGQPKAVTLQRGEGGAPGRATAAPVPQPLTGGTCPCYPGVPAVPGRQGVAAAAGKGSVVTLF